MVEIGNHTGAPLLGAGSAEAVNGRALIACHDAIHVIGVGFEFFNRSAPFIEGPALYEILALPRFAQQAIEGGAQAHFSICHASRLAPHHIGGFGVEHVALAHILRSGPTHIHGARSIGSRTGLYTKHTLRLSCAHC